MLENQYQLIGPGRGQKTSGLIYEGIAAGPNTGHKKELQNICDDLYKNIVPKENDKQKSRTRNNYYTEGI